MTSETGTAPAPRRRRIFILLPFPIFTAIAALLFVGLQMGDPSKLPSVLIGKPVPEFSLPPLEGLKRADKQLPGFDTAVLQTGKVKVVNVWASWCGPCRDEHPYLVELAKDGRFDIYGLNYKDKGENARRFLGLHGNPYDAVGVDKSGRIGIEWGVYGIPETFVVDRKGEIIFKHVGPITDDVMRLRLVPAIERALDPPPA